MKIPLEESKTFSCSACGVCCSHIKGFIPEGERTFIEQYAFGKLPLVQVAPVSEMTFPLYDFEAKRFLEWNKEKELAISIKPLRVIYDQLSGKTIVVTYYIESETDACPYLKENKCVIYDKKRAYVCRLFPFNKSPLQGKLKTDELFGQCGTLKPLVENMPTDYHQWALLKEMFPNGEFVNAVQNDYIVGWINQTIIHLMKNKKLAPLFNVPYEKVKEKIDLDSSVDFLDFLVSIKYMTPAQKEEFIEQCDHNEHAQALMAKHEQHAA